MAFQKKCCILSCDNPSLIKHTFPNPNKNINRFKNWITACKNSVLDEMEPWTVFKTKRVCHRHFEPKYFSGWSHKLFATAIPTLNLPDTSSPVTDELMCNMSSVSTTVHKISECSTSKIVEDNIHLLSPYQVLKQSGVPKHTLTPKKIKMYAALQQLNKRYNMEKSRKKSFKRRLFDAEKFQKSQDLEGNVSRLNSLASLIIRCQFQESQKSKKLRRFTLDEKLLALTLYKQSVRSYSLLSRIFILPSKSTLHRLLTQIVGKPGINNAVFEALQELSRTMQPSEKYVAILFDEMAIMPSLHFNEQDGYIDGFEDMGDDTRQSCLADHVLLFMVRGIKKQWKVPISFHFTSKGGATLQIKHLLLKIIQKLINIALKPITIICDQKNSSVINSLLRDTREEYLKNGNIDSYRTGSFEVDGVKIYPIYDPPHLIKGIRNNFIKKDLRFTKDNVTKTAKWKHIEKLYESDNTSVDGLKVLPHLTDEHVYEKKLKKMKVKNAVQIFSQRLAATLNLVSQIDTQRRIGDNVEETAELLFFFDRLFDSVNGSNKLPDKGKMLRCGLTDTSEHLSFWNKEALPLLASMEFEKKSMRDQTRPPSLKHWSFTIQNIKCIWYVLKSEGFSYLLPRRLNQDPIENTFGQLRSFGAQNINPSPAQFQGVFKILFFQTAISFYKHSFNCENDQCENMFIPLKKLFVESNDTHTNIEALEFANISETTSHNFSEKLQELATSYVAGFILKKIKKNVICSECKNSLFTINYDLPQNILISFREYDTSIRRLCYPTTSFVVSFYSIFKTINFCLDEKPHCKALVHQVENIVNSSVNFEFLTCSKYEHKESIIKLILTFSIRTIIHNWCKSVNKILQGKSNLYTGSNTIKLKANKIRLDRLKRKNAKRPEHIITEGI